jgi:hypothetical protein
MNGAADAAHHKPLKRGRWFICVGFVRTCSGGRVTAACDVGSRTRKFVLFVWIASPCIGCFVQLFDYSGAKHTGLCLKKTPTLAPME